MTKSPAPVTHIIPPLPREIGAVNWLGLFTLVKKEIRRFLKIYNQSIVAPVFTTLLFFAVFALAFGGAGKSIGSVPYMTFLIPGLIMMSMAQNSFGSTSGSIVMSKMQGNIVDVLMPPLSSFELTIGYMLGGVARGIIVGLVSIIVMSVFTHLPVYDIGYIIYHAIMGSMMLSLLGIISGIWADKYDYLAVVQNFLVTPATFLSGTFYSVNNLPGNWKMLCHLNPFYYMIDGFRYGFTGVSDGALDVGLLTLLATNILLFVLAYVLFLRGYKLKM